MAQGMKETLPWESQYGGWSTLSQFSPFYAQGFESAKPNMYEQVFGKRPSDEVGSAFPAGRYMQTYDPWGFTGMGSTTGPYGQMQMANRQASQANAGYLSPYTLGGQQQYGSYSPYGGGQMGGYTPYGGGQMQAPQMGGQQQAGGGQYPQAAGGVYPYTDLFSLPQDEQLGMTRVPPGYARPGGPSPYEQDVLNRSLYGQVSPFPMAGPYGANQQFGGNLGRAEFGQIGNFGAQAAGALGLGNMQNFNAAPYTMGALQSLLGGTPGASTGVMNAVTPGQIFQNVNAQGPALSGYVNQATGGMRAEFQQELARQMQDLQEKYNYEGGYLGSPMFSAMGELASGLTGQYLRDMGGMQLGAAEAERGRQYTAAQNQAQNALSALGVYGPLAGQMGGQQAGLFSDTAGARASIVNNAMNLLNSGYATNFNQAFQMASAQQQNETQALQALQQQFYGPGERALELYNAINKLPTVKKTTGGGFDWGGLALGIGSAAANYFLPGSGAAIQAGYGAVS